MKVLLKGMAVCLLIMVQAAPSFGDEIVPIGSILSDPALFTNRLTTIRGPVVQLDPLPRVRAKGCPYHDRYHAVLEDDTGSMEAIVCGAPLDERGPIFKGDTVVLRSAILVTNGEGGQTTVMADGVRMERAIERP
ncbi:MAG: hypothetical protein U0236_12160 [Nitrospira sp.]